jgi:hypothetical protein
VITELIVIVPLYILHFWLVVIGAAWYLRNNRGSRVQIDRRDRIVLLAYAGVSTFVMSLFVIVLIQAGLITVFPFWSSVNFLGLNSHVLILLSIPFAVYVLVVSRGKKDAMGVTPTTPLPFLAG